MLNYYCSVFDSGHQAIVIHAVYNYLILDFANPIKVIEMVWCVSRLSYEMCPSLIFGCFQEHSGKLRSASGSASASVFIRY